MSERAKISPIYNDLWQYYRLFESGQFSHCATPTEKEISRQVVTCKLAHEVEPTNRVRDKSYVYPPPPSSQTMLKPSQNSEKKGKM